MGILERIKKKQLVGFREFVMNLETASFASRGLIFTSGILEDPMYMSWVIKNIKTFDDFMNLPRHEIENVLTSHENILSVFVRALDGERESVSPFLERTIPNLIPKIKYEWKYLKDVTPDVRIAARSHIMKVARKLQSSESILGFVWQLPPMEVFYPKTYKDGMTEICYDSGVMAAKGVMEKNHRFGSWVHYYDNGRILAQGDYLHGLKEGEWNFFYSSGNLRAKGSYFADLRNGLWQEWDRDGISTKVEYKEGSRV